MSFPEPQKNPETIDMVNHNKDERNIKNNIIKYLAKCYIPFVIVFVIYIILNYITNQSYNKTHSDGFEFSLMFFYIEVIFILVNFVIILPDVILSTKKILKQFDVRKTEFKIIDFIVIIITGIATSFLTIRINVLAFFLVPIIVLLYFSNDYMSKEKCKRIYVTLIVSLLISGCAMGLIFYKVIILYNIIIIPTISIIFYLLNKQKIQFKINKLIPITLILVILIFSSYQFLLKNNKSSIEEVKKENISLKFEDIQYLYKIAYADDEKIYIISSYGTYYNDTKYLSKYSIVNNKFEVLFSNVKDTISGDGLLFFSKSNNIYMINLQNDEVKKIIDKKYYGNKYHYMYYDSGILYVSSGNTIYSYNIDNSKINSFRIDKGEYIQGIIKNSIITSKNNVYSNDIYSYDYNGKKIRLTKLPSYFSNHLDESGEVFVYQNYLYYFSSTNKNANSVIIRNNLQKEQSHEYVVDWNEIFYDETQQMILSGIFNAKILGIYNNKMYIDIVFRVKNNDTNSGYMNYYENIYYFDISIFDETNETKNIKLNTLYKPVKSSTINTYFSDNCIYRNNGQLYKYNLENNSITTQYVGEYEWYFNISYGNYIYASNISDIYRIDKDNLKIEKILGEN